jgi:hypothetical protein
MNILIIIIINFIKKYFNFIKLQDGLSRSGRISRKTLGGKLQNTLDKSKYLL